MAQDPAYTLPTYTRAARRYHWWIAALIVAQIPLGLYMTYRGKHMPGVNDKGEPITGVWDALTGLLYSSHKLLGVVILLLVVGRVVYRVTRGAPPPDPSLPPILRVASHVVHGAIYVLLLAVPLIGYVGTSYYGALNVFGIPFPAVTAKDEKFSEQVFELHEAAAMLLAALVVAHIGAALFHKFIRKDRIVERMIPKRSA